jgi:hypothetical protein
MLARETAQLFGELLLFVGEIEIHLAFQQPYFRPVCGAGIDVSTGDGSDSLISFDNLGEGRLAG